MPEFSKNGLLRVEQHKAALDAKRRLELARGFVAGKLANLRTFLGQKADKSAKSEVKRLIKQLKDAQRGARRTRKLEQLRAYEGAGSAAYFSGFRYMIKTPEFTFETRVRRPPTDPVNALLSFGYTLLAHDMFAAVNVVGFDPYVGYLHAEEYGRPSLPLDLMEEFRPVIVDAMVLAIINQGIVTRADFQQAGENACLLTDEGRKKFLAQYEQRRNTEFTHPVLERKMTYQQSLEQQARQLSKTLQGELEAYPPLCMK
jgi:CRISPR-associated protein Cas1